MPLKLTKRPDSPYWHLRGTVFGVAVAESTKTADKKQAEVFRVHREAEIFKRKTGGAKATATFLEAAVMFMDNGGESRFLEPLLRHFGETLLTNIGQAEVEQCAKKLYPKGAPGTIDRQVFSPVSAVLTHAAKRKLCDKPMFERPKLPKGRVRWLTFAEADRLIAPCAPHLAPIVTFMFYTGARVGEVLSLDWHEVDLEKAHATFLDTKNGDNRGTPLHPRVLAVLSALEHRMGKVFLTDDKRPYALKANAGGQLKSAFKGACRRAGIDNFHPHDCRHTWATWHYKANRSLTDLMSLGGWRSVAMVMRYAHVNVDDLSAGVNRLGDVD